MSQELISQLMNLQISRNESFHKHYLMIGTKHVEVKWAATHNISEIIISVYNTNSRKRNFHIVHDITSPNWNIIEDHNGTLEVTIYGIHKTTRIVTISSKKTFQPTSQDTMDFMLLNNHDNNKSLLNGQAVNDGIMETEVKVDQIVPTSQKSSVVFKFPQSNSAYYIQIIQPLNHRRSGCGEYISWSHNINNNLLCNWSLQSRNEFKYQIYQLSKSSRSARKFLVDKVSQNSTFITHYTKADVEELYTLAKRFREERLNNRRCTKTIPVPFVYRNKPTKHPTIVEAMATGIMAKYIKDNNGDKCSSINSNINGLFLSGSVNQRTKLPPAFSYFGNYRLKIPPHHILPGLNLYFADFYCHAPKRPHYATLVLTNPGSFEDIYCRDRLPKMDIQNNKLFYFDSQIGYRATKAFHIELFYTEDINLTRMKLKSGVEEEIIKDVRGRGESRPEGIPKYIHCTKCNLQKS